MTSNAPQVNPMRRAAARSAWIQESTCTAERILSVTVISPENSTGPRGGFKQGRFFRPGRGTRKRYLKVRSEHFRNLGDGVRIANHDCIHESQGRQQKCPRMFLAVGLRESDYQAIAVGARLFERFQMPRGERVKTIVREPGAAAAALPPANAFDSFGKRKNLSAHGCGRFPFNFAHDFGAR